MKQRLSRRRTIFEKIFLTAFLFLFLSLPTPFGLLNFLLIPSKYAALVVFQRIIHFALLFTLINRLLKNRFYLEYDTEYLHIIDKDLHTKVPLSKVYQLELLPKFMEFNKQSYRFSLSYFDEGNSVSEVTFYAFPGARLNSFIELVKKKNKDFAFENFTLFG